MNILKEEHLSSLPQDLVEKAKTMSKVYEYMYCIENMLRIFLIEKLQEDFRIPTSVRQSIDKRKQSEANHKWISPRGDSELFYSDFTDLSGIITINWDQLEDDFPSQNWIRSKLEDLSRYRNMIAHNSLITNTDFEVIRVYFNAISKQLNLANNSKSQSIEDNRSIEFVKGIKHSKVYSYSEICDGVTHPLFYPLDLDVAPEFIKTEFAQIAASFSVVFKESRVHLLPNFSTDQFEYLEQYYDHMDNIKIQIGQHDIDSDGIDELFICLQVYDPNQELENELVINMFKYYPTAFHRHSNRPENWEQFGPFHTGLIFGEPSANITEGHIFISRNFRGDFNKWNFVDGNFIQSEG